MSAEKEIINYWLNLQNFFTISNIKVKNKDMGILALKLDNEKIKEALHIEVSCSVSGNTETTDLELINKFIDAKFFDAAIRKKIGKYRLESLKNILVLGSLPKSRKKEIISKFRKKGIDIMEFENIISSVIINADTQYYKDDVIRTLQLVKHLLLSNPKKLSELVNNKNILNTNTRSQFLNELLELELIKKGLTKADEGQIISLLNHSALKKPEKLAELLEKSILNRRTRKPFLNSLLEQEKMRKLYVKTTKKKSEKPLSYFLR